MNEEFVYPGGRGNIVGDPQDLPRFAVEWYMFLTRWEGSIYRNDTGNFWSWVDKAGAIAGVTAVNTWTPVVDIVGRGFLGNVIASHGNTSDVQTIGIRVEWDGKLWDWVQTGSSFVPTSTIALGALSPGGGAFPTWGRQMESADAVSNHSAQLVPVSALMSNGAPVLEFKQSLKVSVRNSSIDPDYWGRFAGCTFVLR